MSDYENNADKPDLHLHADPEAMEIECMLDRLGRAEREAMPDAVRGRVLDAVSGVIAPEPIAIEPTIAEPSGAGSGQGWRWRSAAAVLLTTGTTLAIVSVKPWNIPAPTEPPRDASTPAPTGPGWTLAAFEEDFDEYLELGTLDDGQLAEAVTDWEIWAQSVDTDIDASIYGYELRQPSEGEGAI